MIKRIARNTQFRAGLAAVACWAFAMISLEAAEPRKEEKSSLLSKLNPVSIFDNVAPDERHVLEAERPVARITDDSERHVHPIYFPPNPPPLGVELSLRAVDARVGAPPELAPHAFEPFYAALSTRLVERSLTRKQEDALAAYVTRKAVQMRDLRTRLAEVAMVGPELRLLALEEFAARQTPALAALEQEAQAFRLELYTKPMSSSGGSWFEWRGWRLGRGRLDLPREQTLFLEGQLLRGAAFYQEGLTPAQRLLLRECAIELESVVFPDQRAVGPSVHEWFWFFSPHLARVHLPDDLPSDLQERIAGYREEKEALKTELRDTIYENDRTRFGSVRTASIETLAKVQTPRLEALEREAEMIRRRLAVVAPLPAPPLPPSLPPTLATMVDEYTREKTALERDLSERVRRAVRHMQVPGSYEPERSTLAWHAARLEAIDQARVRFREENAGRIDALKEKLNALRSAVEAWAGPESKDESRGGTGSFLKDFFARRSELQGRHECHLAVFEPGLSPEQRRLLFEAGLTALNLPLPGPEEQPTSLPGTLLK